MWTVFITIKIASYHVLKVVDGIFDKYTNLYSNQVLSPDTQCSAIAVVTAESACLFSLYEAVGWPLSFMEFYFVWLPPCLWSPNTQSKEPWEEK